MPGAGPAPTIARIARDLPPPIPAATVVVLRDGESGLEALLLRRDEGGTFGGMWVFPGGRVDDADVDRDAPDAEQAAARQAAVREAFEEAGLSLDARRAGALRPLDAPTDRAEALLDVVLRHESAERRGGRRRRRGARPRVARSPPRRSRRHAEESLPLAPPTWVTLHQLTALRPGVGRARRARSPATPERFSTRPLEVDGVRVLTWHGDVAYDDGIDRAGPRHRLWMPVDAPWRYERTAPF